MVAPALAEEKVVAMVNGKTITETDMRLADAEIGSDLGNLPADQRRRVLVEYLIENQLFADAAEKDKLSSRPAFDERMGYWRRRAMRDAYFDEDVKGSVSEADVRKFYETQLSGMKPEEEVRARHILVDSEQQAKEIFEFIAHGSDFADMARKHSKDPGSREEGGDLGYFSRGQMVPEFEATAFKLNKGDVSMPVQSQFGWHLIKLEDRRQRKAPPYDSVKERISAALIHRKAQEVVGQLRGNAKIDFVDPALKQAYELENRPRPVPAGR
jgi:peptidyl-prolyl cis-trans isomerase C